jgi:hypothetical protein
MPSATLNSWNQEFDEKLQPLIVPDHRGKSSKVTVDMVRKVVETAKTHKANGRRIRLAGFTKQLAKKQNIMLSTKTVKDILIANGLREAKTRHKRPAFYQSLCQHIPNGLLSVDGSQFTVWLDDIPFTFNVELAVDVNSFNHTAFSVSDTETAEEVLKVLDLHRSNWGTPLGMLCDKGSANLSGKVDAYLRRHDIQPVPVGPSNPKGNGTDEGAFGWMKRTIGAICLNTCSPRALAESILEIIIALYIKLRNKLPLKKPGRYPEGLMIQPAVQKVREQQRQQIQKHIASKADTTNQPKLNSLHAMVANLDMHPEDTVLRRAEKSIVAYEIEAIKDAEKAFIKAVNRKSQRLNLSYFFGILKRIQTERDNQAYAQYCRNRYNYQQMLQAEKIQKQMQKQQEPPDIEDVLNMLLKAANAPKRFVKELALKRAKEWTAELIKDIRYMESLRRKFTEKIALMSNLTSQQKDKIWQLVEDLLTNLQTECVTLVS